MSRTIRIPITNTLLGGDYSGLIYVGSQKRPANVLLDTGSSSLGVDGNHYDPSADRDATITKMVQEVQYVDQSGWIGAVVQTDITVGEGQQALSLPKAYAAVVFRETRGIFRQADGILGLAYTGINDAYILSVPSLPPNYNANQIQNGRRTHLKPYFTQLEESGVVANKFAFYTLRSTVNNATANPARDPLNNGWLILGGGEESTDLYGGPFQTARVLHDKYYNTNLKALIVGNSAPIEVPPPTRASGNVTNSVVDSGTQPLLLDQTLFDAMANHLSKGNDRTLVHAMRSGYLPMSNLNLASWPKLTFVLEGVGGNDAQIVVTPETYWQLDSPEKGFASSGILGDEGQLAGQSILGLPLMNNYLTIFDRSVNHGLGVVKFATAKGP